MKTVVIKNSSSQTQVHYQDHLESLFYKYKFLGPSRPILIDFKSEVVPVL